MNTYSLKKVSFIVTAMVIMHAGLFAQVKNDAAKAFNTSIELMKADPDAAIASFEDCIKICEQVGDSAFDIQVQAEQVLPGLYYQKASNLLLVDKKVEESLAASKKTIQVAEKFDNQKVKENTQKIMIQAYSNMASAFLAGKENEKAIQAYDSLLAINPNHLTVLYNKALIYKSMDNGPKFAEAVDVYIGKLTPTGDTVKIEQARQIARDYFRIAGGKANAANKLTDALNLLNTASKYDADKGIYYQYANIYNKQKKYALAAENALKGLELEKGTPEEKAKFYYELGSAQAGKGETANACASFKNAMYGQFLEAAKGQRTNLKCQ
jgi:tetratricopeptide (TPR) repeat protein